jgi:Flp pilus assembly protein TadG
MDRGKAFLSRLIRRNSGVAALEFAIVLPVLILLIAGLMDLGHAFYLKQIITNASREGARYGAVYVAKPNGYALTDANRLAPVDLTPSIQNWVLKSSAAGGQCDLTHLLNGDNSTMPAPTVDVGGAGYTSGISGQDLTVTVKYQMNWWILDKFIPGLTNPLDLTATTTMRLE